MEKGPAPIVNDDRTLDRASALLRMRSFNEAEAVLQIRLRSLPDDVSSLRLLGTCLLRVGRADDALPPLRRVVTLLGSSPGSAAARYELAGALRLAGRHAEAAVPRSVAGAGARASAMRLGRSGDRRVRSRD
jgi:Flp pilus assembly protein TadD